MEKKTLCSILKYAINARRQYMQSFYVLSISALIGILAKVMPPLAFIAIPIFIIGALLWLLAFISHIGVLKQIKTFAEYDPYTPIVYAIVIQAGVIIISLIYVILIHQQTNSRNISIASSIIFNLIYITIYLTLFDKMYRNIENALNIHLREAYTLGLWTAIFGIAYNILPEPYNIIFIPPWIGIWYFHLRAFLEGYISKYTELCQDT